jgi:hypothetical protein
MNRIHKLNDGDVFTVKGLTVKFEDNQFHEVKFGGHDDFMQSIWNRTGTIYNMDELNSYCK